MVFPSGRDGTTGKKAVSEIVHHVKVASVHAKAASVHVNRVLLVTVLRVKVVSVLAKVASAHVKVALLVTVLHVKVASAHVKVAVLVTVHHVKAVFQRGNFLLAHQETGRDLFLARQEMIVLPVLEEREKVKVEENGKESRNSLKVEIGPLLKSVPFVREKALSH